MNVVTAAPAAAPRARGTSTGHPVAGDDFAALLAGLAAQQSTCPAQLDEPVNAAPTDQPLPDEPAEAQSGLDALALTAPPAAPLLVAAPVVAARAVATALPAVAAAPARSAPARSAATSAATASTADAAAEPPGVPPAAPAGSARSASAGSDALSLTPVAATTAPAAPDVRPAAGPVAPAQQTSAQLVGTQAGTAGAPAAAAAAARVAAPTGRPTTTGSAAATTSAPVAPVLPAVATVEPRTSAGALLDPATIAAPDAVELSVPVDVAGDSPVPALDARSTASPAAPAAAAQTAGPAVAEAMLPTDAAGATTAATPGDAARPETTPAVPAAAAGVVGAEGGVAAPQAADARVSASASAAAAAPPPPPATQVVQLLTPVLAGPDGSYSLSLQLYPEELGAVQVEVLLRGGEIRLALHASDEAAQAALRSALPDLKADLQAGGLSATSLSVDDGRPGQSFSDRSADRSPDRRPDGQGDSPGRRPHPYRSAEPASRPPTSHSDAALDLRM